MNKGHLNSLWVSCNKMVFTTSLHKETEIEAEKAYTYKLFFRRFRDSDKEFDSR